MISDFKTLDTVKLPRHLLLTDNVVKLDTYINKYNGLVVSILAISLRIESTGKKVVKHFLDYGAKDINSNPILIKIDSKNPNNKVFTESLITCFEPVK